MVENEVALEMYRRAVRIRMFEESVSTLKRRGQVPGVVHLSIGQEGEIVGACAPLRRDDYMTGNHRSHGHPIGKGAEIAPLMAEIFGKRTGVCRGRGGSMHLADFSVGSLGESSIVGGGLPVAVGAGLSIHVRGTDQVCLCFFGDGAVNCGNFHESLNLAAVWGLPVIFVCENNMYAVSTAIRDTTAGAGIANRACAYGIPGVAVDGQDAIATYESVAEAVSRARAGGGPTLVEAKTYRYHEHAEGIPRSSYRTEEEVESWKGDRDPLVILRRWLLDHQAASEAMLDGIEGETKKLVDDAVDFALSSEDPEPTEAFEDVFSPATV